MTAAALRVAEIQLFERDVRLRMPFRFGVVTLREAPQLFARARIATPDGREAWGLAAELLAPKWFDKELTLSNEDNFDQLRLGTSICRERYLAEHAPLTPFGLFAAHYAGCLEAGARRGLNALVASFGPALLDRAVLDALCRMRGISFYTAIRSNLAAVSAGALTPDLASFDLPRFLAGLAPALSIHARHTVGLVDPITGADQKPEDRVGDGLPETLEDVIRAYGCTYFKLKVAGDVAADIERLCRIAAVLDRASEPYFASLDGNEQFRDGERFLALWRGLLAEPRLRRLVSSILFIEQPVNRKAALDGDMSAASAVRPVVIDESDADLDAFPRARGRGYRGVSSKACKGFYKSLLNAARCAAWNEEAGGNTYFMSGEDLTTQAGVAVQQDLALVNLLGLAHVERNGHHYVDGMAGAPASEQAAFAAAHPDLYRSDGGVTRLRIERGRLAIGSLACAGFAVGAEPDWRAMRPMPEPAMEPYDSEPA